MQTNIDIDDELVNTAFRYASVKTKRDLVHLALREFIKQHQRRDLRELRGRGGIAEDYDHRTLREPMQPEFTLVVAAPVSQSVAPSIA